jgi:hypothetical protein
VERKGLLVVRQGIRILWGEESCQLGGSIQVECRFDLLPHGFSLLVMDAHANCKHASPSDLDNQLAVLLELRIGCQQMKRLGNGLGDEEPVEWVCVVEGKG